MKRIFLFVVSNLLIMLTITALYYVASAVLGIGLGYGVAEVALFSLVFGFGSATISLLLSKTFAKFAYSIETVDVSKLAYSPDSKLSRIYDTVTRIASSENMKVPEFGIYQDDVPNAFATGPTRNSALVAVSSGLLDHMDENEISGVIGHEMAHVANGDMVTMTLIQGLMNTFVLAVSSVLSRIAMSALKLERDSVSGAFVNQLLFTAFQITFGIAASLVTYAYSRHREFVADADSAKYLGKEPMLAALKKLKAFVETEPDENRDAITALGISSPKKRFELFSTHPSIDDRIARLLTN